MEYYNVNRLLTNNSMAINRALLKYGFYNFSLKILEYCDINILMNREKHYFDLLLPEYNLALLPGAPSRGKGRRLSLETRNKLSKIAINRSPEVRARIRSGQLTGQIIQVIDILTNIVTVYSSIRATSKSLNINKIAIINYINLKKADPVLDRYTFVKMDKPSTIRNNIQKSSLKIEVTDIETGSKKIYPSVTSAAKTLGLYQASISLYLKEKRTKPFKSKYIFKLIT